MIRNRPLLLLRISIFTQGNSLSHFHFISNFRSKNFFYFSFYIMDKHTFENLDEQNYTLDLSLYDNVNVLAEGLDILEQELFKSLYHSKSFWSTHVAKRAKVMADLYH